MIEAGAELAGTVRHGNAGRHGRSNFRCRSPLSSSAMLWYGGNMPLCAVLSWLSAERPGGYGYASRGERVGSGICHAGCGGE